MASNTLIKMIAFVEKQPTETLCGSLEILATSTSLSHEERMAHAVIVDVLCNRYPAVDQAFDAWAESDETDGAAAVIVAAARAAAATQTGKGQ